MHAVLFCSKFLFVYKDLSGRIVYDMLLLVIFKLKGQNVVWHEESSHIIGILFRSC